MELITQHGEAAASLGRQEYDIGRKVARLVSIMWHPVRKMSRAVSSNELDGLKLARIKKTNSLSFLGHVTELEHRNPSMSLLWTLVQSTRGLPAEGRVHCC